MNGKAISAICGILALGMAGHAAGAEMPTLRVDSDGGLNHLPLIIAQKQGLFEKHGIHVETIPDALVGPYSNSQAAMRGYVPQIERGGLADLTVANGGFFIDAVLNGSEAVAIGTMTANPVYSLVVRPEIATYDDLRGKTITLTAQWDGITLTSLALLAQHGIGQADFTFEAIRMSDARMECMQAGRCAAIVAVQPIDIKAVELGEGYHRLGTTLEAGPINFYIEVVRRSWAEENRDTLVRYLRAKAEAIHFIDDPANHAEVTAAIAEITGETPEIVEQVVASYANADKQLLTANGEVDPEDFGNLLQMAKDAGYWDQPYPAFEAFVDLSYGRDAGIQ